MKTFILFILIALLIPIGLGLPDEAELSLDFDYPGQVYNNATANVNRSDFWDNLDTPTDLYPTLDPRYLKNWFDQQLNTTSEVAFGKIKTQEIYNIVEGDPFIDLRDSQEPCLSIGGICQLNWSGAYINLNENTRLHTDLKKLYFGGGDDTSLSFNISDFIINEEVAGQDIFVLGYNNFVLGKDSLSLGDGTLTTTGKIGVGDVTPEASVDVETTVSAGTGYDNIYSKLTATGTGGTVVHNALNFWVVGAHTAGTLYGLKGVTGRVSHWGTGATSNIYAGSFSVDSKGSATIGNVVNMGGMNVGINPAASGVFTATRALGYTYSIDAEDATFTSAYGIWGQSPAVDGGSMPTFAHIWLDDADAGNINYGMVLDDDDLDVVFGEGQDARVYYNASDLIVNPAKVGTGDLVLGDGSKQVNISFFSPDGTHWTCGVNNAGTFSCS